MLGESHVLAGQPVHTDVCAVSQCIDEALWFNNRVCFLCRCNLYEIIWSNEGLLKPSRLMSAWIRNDRLHPLTFANNPVIDLKSRRSGPAYAGLRNYKLEQILVNISVCYLHFPTLPGVASKPNGYGDLQGSESCSWGLVPSLHFLSFSPTTNGHSMDLTMTP